jgi:hypothetical protein
MATTLANDQTVSDPSMMRLTCLVATFQRLEQTILPNLLIYEPVYRTHSMYSLLFSPPPRARIIYDTKKMHLQPH